jgi:hypothetical protein
MSIRFSLTDSEAITLATRMQDLAQLELECEDVQRINRKLRRKMGLPDEFLLTASPTDEEEAEPWRARV